MAAPTGLGADQQKRVQDYIKREFNALMRVPRRTLFHYTTGPAAAAILDETGFRATNLLFLDSGKEMQHGVDCLRAAIESRRLRVPRPMKDVEEMVSARIANASLNPPPDVWVVSFTEHHDSTLHWQTYQEASHGVALGFKPDRLIDVAAESGAVLAPCLYDDGAKIGVMSRALDLLDQMLAARGAARTPAFDAAVLRQVLTEIALFGSLMKRQDLADENEWRLILCNATQTIAGAQRIRAVAEADYTGLSVDLPLDGLDERLPLERIVIGPSPHQTLTERAFRTLLYKSGYEDVDVDVSS